MKKKILFTRCCLATVFVLCMTYTNAANNKPFTDSTCCTPDSLKLVSVNFPVFCVSWKVRADSTCRRPRGFEIEWKTLTVPTWKIKFVAYTSGNTINFCDSIDTCDIAYTWRVRTKCNDSTYSSWVSGGKITVVCGGKINVPDLSILPNPAAERITIAIRSLKPELYRISIVNMSGRTMLEKAIYIKDGEQLKEQLSVSSWQKGIYFVSIISKGNVISRASFVKQ